VDAIAMNPKLQLLPSAVHQTPKALFRASQTFIRVVDLTEARQLSQFATFIVLMPGVIADDGILLSPMRDGDFNGVSQEAHGLLDFFNKTTTRSKASYADSDFEFGDLKVNFSTMEVSRGGEPMTLTALEFKTLKYLIQNARRVISRDEFLRAVWGYENYPTTRVVDNQVAKLRKKMERDTSRPVHFRTVHGAGYKFLP
jgi:Transcriptional regulatory protein, C terminal